MKKLFVIVFCCLISGYIENINAQTKQQSGACSVRGKLVEKTGSPVEFANVILYRSTDSTMVTWTISGEKGEFSINKIPAGQYYISVRMMGFRKKNTQTITISSGKTDENLNNIFMEQESAVLNEVVITADRRAVESKIDRKIINVAKDITASGGSAVDILKNVPSVSVDVDGGVTLRGNSNVSILIDGRPTSIDATRLDQIPSSDIESVEIITNPSAKFNPEGMTGIINLKLKKKRNEGFNGILQGTMGNGNKYTGSAGINYRSGAFNFYGNYSGRYNDIAAKRYLFRNSYNADTSYLEQNVNTMLKIRSGSYKIGSDININPKNSISFYWQTDREKKIDADLTLSDYFSRDMLLTNTCLAVNSENSNEKSNDYALSYKKTFDRKDEELTVDYTFSTEKENLNQPQTYTYPDSVNSFIIYSLSKQYNSNMQVNWVLPIGTKSQLESGVQSIIRRRDDNFNQSNYFEDVLTDDPSRRDHFVYTEQIHAAYSTFSTSLKNLSIMAGARLEETYTDATQVIGNLNTKRNYFNIYPNLHINQKLSESQNLQFSYSRRIDRPVSEMLNPFVDKSNPDLIRTGNPNLKPQYVNSVEGGYSISGKNSSFGLTGFYKRMKNVINRITTLDSLNVSWMMPQNESLGENYGLELTFEQNITKWWKINGNVSAFRNSVKGDNTQNSNYTSIARIMTSWTPLKSLSAQISGSYRGPQVSIQSRMKPMYSIDFAMNKNFLNDHLSMTLRISDIFNTLKMNSTTWGYNYLAENWRKRESRVAYFGIIYRFGSQTKQKNGKAAEENYDNNGAVDF